MGWRDKGGGFLSFVFPFFFPFFFLFWRVSGGVLRFFFFKKIVPKERGVGGFD